MVQYSADGKQAVYCGYKFRRDPKTGYYLCTKPSYMGRRERLHVFVWRTNNGDIPEGYHIHHKDEDKSNNELSNLECLPGAEHMTLHSREYAAMHYDDMIENLNRNVRPKAIEWHKSEAGRAWHREHYCEYLGKAEPIKHKCQVCGKEFLSRKKDSAKFCSNNCKSAARRKSGVDNETRKCELCGKEYVCNKYAQKRFCSSECRYNARWNIKYQEGGKAAGL